MAKSFSRVSPVVRDCFVRSFTREEEDPLSEFKRLLMATAAERKNTPLPKEKLQSAPLLKLGKGREEEKQQARERRQKLLALEPIEGDALDRIEWQTTRDAIHLAGGEGSTGVYLVEVMNRAVILKPGGWSTPGELFCSLLYEKLGMLVPRQRILLSKSDGELEKLRAAVGREEIPVAEEGKLRLKIELDKASCFSVIEFVRSEPLVNFAKVTKLDRARLLGQIGKTMVLDVLVNNGDRIPLIHRGEGNASNLLLCPSRNGIEMPNLCLIDNNINAIVNPAGRETYLEAVSRVARSIMADSNEAAPKKILEMASVSHFLLVHADVLIESEDEAAVLNGVRQMMKQVTSAYSRDQGLFKDIKEQTACAFQREQGGVTLLKPGIDAISEEFLYQVHTKFKL